MDDDRDLRESLALLLRALGQPVVEFASAEEFRAFYDGTQRGCLILDLHMPGQGGLELYDELVRTGHLLPVIFITAHADIPTAVAAMKTGAIEFLEKPFDRKTLAERVETALALEAVWNDKEQRFQDLDENIRHLSPTDRETLGLVLQGLPNKAMAAQLHITERAVELRRQRMMQRLGVRTLAELLDVTITHRLLEEFRTVRTMQVPQS